MRVLCYVYTQKLVSKAWTLTKYTNLCVFRVLAGVKRFTLGLIYLAVYTLLQPKFKESFLITEEYDVSSKTSYDHFLSFTSYLGNSMTCQQHP